MRAVLTFHGIDTAPGPLSYAPEALDGLLAALAISGVPVLDLDRLLEPGTSRGVAITFDDGLRSLYTTGLPILRAHRVPAHLFLSTGAVDAGGRPGGRGAATLTWDMVEKLHQDGIAIESHTHRHPDLRQLSDAAILAECSTADALIERRTGRPPRYFAYPFGCYDRRVAAQIARRYPAAFTTRLAFLSPGDEPARLPRVDVHYLRSRFVYRHLEARSTRWFLQARRLARVIRGSESLSIGA